MRQTNESSGKNKLVKVWALINKSLDSIEVLGVRSWTQRQTEKKEAGWKTPQKVELIL